MPHSQKMQIIVKKYEKFSLRELYNVLQLRAAVFVVEQACVYQDIDGKDPDALHILGIKNDRIIAYARCFPPGFYFEEAAIGRVLVKKEERKFGHGHQILKAAITAVETAYDTATIQLSAQQYLTGFYETHGFKTVGKGYLEDGIPHVAMVKK